MGLVPLHMQKLMVITRKLPYSVQSDFPLLSLGITTQYAANGLMTLNCVNLFLVCRTMNTGGGLCVCTPVLENKTIAFRFAPSVCTATWPFEKFCLGTLAQHDSAVVSPCGLLQPMSV